MVTRIRPGWSDLPTNATIDGGSVTVDGGTITIDGVALSSYKSVGLANSVPATTLTTILTSTYSTTFTNISIVSVSGDDYAKYTLVINGTDVDVRRTGPDRNLTFDFTSNPLALSSGDVVDIKVEHFRSGQLLDFNATIYGYATA